MAAAQGTGISSNLNTISTTPEVLVPASNTGERNYPRSVIIKNVDGSNPVTFGPNADVALTHLNGMVLAAGEWASFDLQSWEEIYAVVETTDVIVRVLVFNAGNVAIPGN